MCTFHLKCTLFRGRIANRGTGSGHWVAVWSFYRNAEAPFSRFAFISLKLLDHVTVCLLKKHPYGHENLRYVTCSCVRCFQWVRVPPSHYHNWETLVIVTSHVKGDPIWSESERVPCSTSFLLSNERQHLIYIWRMTNKRENIRNQWEFPEFPVVRPLDKSVSLAGNHTTHRIWKSLSSLLNCRFRFVVTQHSCLLFWEALKASGALLLTSMTGRQIPDWSASQSNVSSIPAQSVFF